MLFMRPVKAGDAAPPPGRGCCGNDVSREATFRKVIPMSRRIDPREPNNRGPSRGRCFVYVLPCAYEDILKLGFSRDPLQRMQALHPRWFEFFDVDTAFLVETETVRDARDLELGLAKVIAEHNAPAPLVIRREAAGHSEWYRGAHAGAVADRADVGRRRIHPAFAIATVAEGAARRAQRPAVLVDAGEFVPRRTGGAWIDANPADGVRQAGRVRCAGHRRRVAAAARNPRVVSASFLVGTGPVRYAPCMHIFDTARLRLRPIGEQDEALYCRLYTDAVGDAFHRARIVAGSGTAEFRRRAAPAGAASAAMDPRGTVQRKRRRDGGVGGRRRWSRDRGDGARRTPRPGLWIRVDGRAGRSCVRVRNG